MKIIITIVFILISSVSYGQEVKTVKFKKYKPVEVTTVCIKGYLFAINNGMSGASMVQMYRANPSTHRPPQPIKCKG